MFMMDKNLNNIKKRKINLSFITNKELINKLNEFLFNNYLTK